MASIVNETQIFSLGLDYVISRFKFGDDDYNLNYWHPLSVDPSTCGR